jgi:hypothetical protein
MTDRDLDHAAVPIPAKRFGDFDDADENLAALRKRLLVVALEEVVGGRSPPESPGWLAPAEGRFGWRSWINGAAAASFAISALVHLAILVILGIALFPPNERLSPLTSTPVNSARPDGLAVPDVEVMTSKKTPDKSSDKISKRLSGVPQDDADY